MLPTTQPLVSIVIPTYNMGAYVADAIRSVQAQTITDLEIIVVDDGSTDHTRDAIAPLLSDPRLKYFYQENAGKSRAKNVAIAAAKGKIIGFCDADDLWLPNKLALQLPCFDTDPDIGIVYTRSQRQTAAGQLLPMQRFPEPTGWVTEELFTENFVPFGTALIRASAFERFGGFAEKYRMGMDWELFLRFSLHCKFAFVEQVTYLYRIWPGQMSHNWEGRFKNAHQIMAEFQAANPNAIPPAVSRRAIAASYANQARARANISGDYVGAIRDALKAIATGYSVIYASRLIIRCLLRVLGISRGPLDPPPKPL